MGYPTFQKHLADYLREMETTAEEFCRGNKNYPLPLVQHWLDGVPVAAVRRGRCALDFGYDFRRLDVQEAQAALPSLLAPNAVHPDVASIDTPEKLSELVRELSKIIKPSPLALISFCVDSGQWSHYAADPLGPGFRFPSLARVLDVLRVGHLVFSAHDQGKIVEMLKAKRVDEERKITGREVSIQAMIEMVRGEPKQRPSALVAIAPKSVAEHFEILVRVHATGDSRYSWAALGRGLGVDEATVRRWCQGAKHPDPNRRIDEKIREVFPEIFGEQTAPKLAAVKPAAPVLAPRPPSAVAVDARDLVSINVSLLQKQIQSLRLAAALPGATLTEPQKRELLVGIAHLMDFVSPDEQMVREALSGLPLDRKTKALLGIISNHRKES